MERNRNSLCCPARSQYYTVESRYLIVASYIVYRLDFNVVLVIQYNIPVDLFVCEEHPRAAPKLYVRPTSSKQQLRFFLSTYSLYNLIHIIVAGN